MLTPDSAARSAYPWLESLEEAMTGVELPMSGSRLAVSIDSSGDDRSSKYWLVAILAMDLDNSLEWVDEAARIRRDHLPDGREMAYKSLSDCHRQRALGPLLSAAGGISGAFVVFALDKRIRHLCATEHSARRLRDSGTLKAQWKPLDFERMSRIALLASCVVARFGTADQAILWVIDQDSAVANTDRHDDFCRMATTFLAMLTTTSFGPAGICTTAVDVDGSGEREVAAIPDLAAGAWREALLSLRDRGSTPSPGELCGYTGGKARKILDWFMDGRTSLQKLFVRFESLASNRIRVHW